MDFEMSTGERLRAAVEKLRKAGYGDASRSNPRMGDPLHVLSVATDHEDAVADVSRIVMGVDPHARPIT